ncbi:hypothetical protein BRD19_11230 [Halobacteriales archaeon SW_7_65_23]|nr:MAG: hypothetical protein BRD19_11230 [Halobacteriales archaeon SW_7_65_23]
MVRGLTHTNCDSLAVKSRTNHYQGSDDALADRQGSLACFGRLTVDQSEYVELAGVDHYMMHGERRAEVFDLVSEFQDRMA